MLRWYLVHTKPCAEAVAEVNLSRQGYEVYFPRLVKPSRSGAHRVSRTTPLFPRYLFLHLCEGNQSLAAVRSTMGVSSVVRFGVAYAIVPDNVISDLRRRADATGWHRLVNPFYPGAPVRVAGGPLKGLEGVFERKVGEERVVVLLELLGRHAPVRVPADLVLAA
jgi:transcriptional antiterminator RfaH